MELQWISIKDKYPEVNQEVLLNVDCETRWLKFTNLWPATYIGNEEWETESFLVDGFNGYTRTEITHWSQFKNQPERSKREDLQKCKMRCSEHCGNTVREAK